MRRVGVDSVIATRERGSRIRKNESRRTALLLHPENSVGVNLHGHLEFARAQKLRLQRVPAPHRRAVCEKFLNEVPRLCLSPDIEPRQYRSLRLEIHCKCASPPRIEQILVTFRRIFFSDEL